jgi:peptidoglycan/xylan/chitin deacetylase (PgdA/CDA1 family)
MLYKEGKTTPKMMSVGLHLRVTGHPGRASGLERFLDHVAQHQAVWVTRRADIARHWQALDKSY